MIHKKNAVNVTGVKDSQSRRCVSSDEGIITMEKPQQRWWVDGFVKARKE